jgi:hypothetical protein
MRGTDDPLRREHQLLRAGEEVSPATPSIRRSISSARFLASLISAALTLITLIKTDESSRTTINIINKFFINIPPLYIDLKNI